MYICNCRPLQCVKSHITGNQIVKTEWEVATAVVASLFLYECNKLV